MKLLLEQALSTLPFAWALIECFKNALVIYIHRENELGEYLPLSEDWSSVVSMKGRVWMILKDWQMIE